MGHSFADIAFTPDVRRVQGIEGSRSGDQKIKQGQTHHDRLGEREIAFLAARDSFYMAKVGETGRPYVQHRGGPPGFLRVLDETTLGFADFRGNRQYVGIGNLAGNDRVSLFLMDYANRARLKILGRARIVGAGDPLVVERLTPADYGAAIERGIVISVEAFDWNRRQHITRIAVADVDTATAAPHRRVAELDYRLRACSG